LCIRYRQKYQKETLLDTIDDEEGNEEVFFNTIAEDNEMFIPESVMENEAWEFSTSGIEKEQWPIEKNHYFAIETENGTEYYAVEILKINARQHLTKNADYVNMDMHSGTAGDAYEFAKSYGSYFYMEMRLYRFYEKE